jgi:hypothetical protein
MYINFIFQLERSSLMESTLLRMLRQNAMYFKVERRSRVIGVMRAAGSSALALSPPKLWAPMQTTTTVPTGKSPPRAAANTSSRTLKLFQDGKPINGNRGSEGGWLSSPNAVGADTNYYNLAYWRILPQGNDKYFIENVETQRYLFQDGGPIKGEGVEGGWTGAPKVVGADANYYNRAYYKLVKI